MHMSANTTHPKQKAAPHVASDAVGVDYAAALAAELLRRQGEKVREARKAAGLTIEQLAERARMHSNTIGRIERGDNEADIEQLLRLAGALGVTPALWMHFCDGQPQPAAERFDADDEFALVPMLDAHISAGNGSVNGDGHEILGRFAFRRRWLAGRGVKAEAARIVRARGQSMADKINDGDILLVDTSIHHLEQDGVYVIELDGLDYVKLLQRDFATGGVQIISYNPAYRPQLLTAEKASELRITGRVVWHGGEL